ncbi:MAG: pyrroline-5-carboxylate reductase [Parvularculaceae bacterium]
MSVENTIAAASPPRVALVGAGAMGGALFKGWLARGAIDLQRSAVFDPQPSLAVAALANESGVPLNPYDPVEFDVLILAIKPQALEQAGVYSAIAARALVVSILAGKSAAAVSAALGGAARVVRAMPNLPSMAGAGVAGLYAPAGLSEFDRALARVLMEAVGAAVFVESEAALDAVTAISGSGPAYFFLMAEALEEAALDLGLPAGAAALLARQTLAGAGAIVSADQRSSAALRMSVTSPGGTTEAAIKVLDGDAHTLRTLMKAAARAAFRRAQELMS